MNRVHLAVLLLLAIVGVLLFAMPVHAAIPVFDAPSITVAENAGAAAFTINKSAKANSYSKIKVETVDGSARAGVDYVAVSTILTFANNQLHATVPVTILDNATFQGSRTFAVRLTVLRFGQLAGSYEPPTVTINDDEVAPAPPPTGPGGEVPVSDGLNLADWLEPGEGPHASPDAVGAFRFTCLASHLAKDDPVVYPGQPGRSHLHQFWGNDGTNAASTYRSLRTTGGSTCTRSVGSSPQRTAYWMPAMLDGLGNAVEPDWINTYYKQLPASDPNCAGTVDPVTLQPGPPIGKCVPLPDGIRFVLGHDMKTMTGGPADTRSRDYWAMGFDCVDKPVGGNSYTGIKHSIADIVAAAKCPLGAWLRVFGAFPQCWNGKDVDSADHRSHIAFPPQATCATDHPFRIPEVAVSAFFSVDEAFLAGKWRLSSDDAMAALTGAPVVAGTTLHFDYFEAWSDAFKALWQANCIDGHLSCSNGNIGDGRQIKGMQMGAMPTHELVPLTSIP